MTWTPTTIDLLDADANPQPFIAYTDGSKFAFAHPLLDNTGAIIAPATSGNQTAGNVSLAAIATNTTGAATAANQATEITALTAIASSVAGSTPAGSAIIGRVGIDQTTPGTTNLVQLPAARITALTPPTTVAVTQATGTNLHAVVDSGIITTVSSVTAIANALPAGTNLLGKVGIDQTTPGTTNGVAVNAALPAGANLIGSVAPPGTVHLTAAPAVTAGAYTSGMVVGGLLTLAGAARINGWSGLLQSVLLTVKTTLTTPSFDVFFFDTLPTSTFTDNAPLSFNNLTDLPYVCGIAHCTDAVSCGTPQVVQDLNFSTPFRLSASNSTSLYALIVIRSSATFASTSALGLSAVVIQD